MRNYNMTNCNAPGCSMIDPRMMEARKREPKDCMCDDYPIGMAYVPRQEFKDLYDPEKSLEMGTMFLELDKPFYGRRAFRK